MPHCQKYIQTLRQRGYRITPQREMIVAALAHSSHHMTAEEIFDRVQAQTQASNIATVYRTLDLLVEEGLACRNNLGGGRVSYATTEHGPHIHLVCRHCGCVIDADYKLLESLHNQLQEKHGFDANLQHISLAGLCKNCQTQMGS
jgi:Fur family ferric uptake transcriptional regulator